jgi:hypothetical protein
MEEFRVRSEALDAHPYAARAIRDLVLRDEDATALAGLRLTAISALHANRETWIGGISRLVPREEPGSTEHLAEVVRMTLALLADEEVDGAVLFADDPQEFLRALGFEVVGGEGIDVDLADLAGPAVSGVTVRALGPSDGPEVRRIHERSGAGEPLWLRRDAVRWDYLLRATMLRSPDPDATPPVQLVSVKNGRIEGYAIAALRGPVLDLLDLGLEERDDASFAALLDSLRTAGASRGCARMRTPVLPGGAGRLLRERFRPIPLREGLMLVASLNERLDPRAIVARGGGYAALERV